MAKNKAAKVNSFGTYVYKNSRYNEDLSNLPKRGMLDYYMFIPSMSNLETGVTSKMSTGILNGKEYYYLTEKKSDMEQNGSSLDFGDNEITFSSCEINQPDNKYLGITDYDKSKYVPIKINMDGYSIGRPCAKKYSSSGQVEGITMLYPQIEYWISNPSQNFSRSSIPYSYASKKFKGNKIKHIVPNYDTENDAFLIPQVGFFGYYKNKDGIDIYDDTDSLQSKNSFNVGREDLGIFGMMQTNSGYMGPCEELNNNFFIYSANNSQYNFSFWYEGVDYQTNNLPTVSSYGDVRLLEFAFTYDETNNELFILYSICGIDYSNEVYINTYIVPISCIKFQASVAVDEDALKKFFNELIVLNLIDSDHIPKPDDELFNDNGPDINGAGDPYNTDEFNNVGSSIGGDADPGKDLNSVDATPNTAFDSFMQDTGFFGSYVLSNSDLVKYTKTLRMLYSNADNPAWGEAAGLQADHIVKNTIGLHMLPITIPSTDYASTTFSMGTVGISESGKWLSYATGNDYANANYLKKLTKTFNVPLGKIKHNYDNFLDFAPYSSASLYIPYIGKVELPINLIQSTSEEERLLRLEFRVNYSSGDFMAILFCNIKGVEVAVSHWNGNCARNVKVSVDDDSSAIIAGANRIASMFSASMSLTSGSNNFGGTLTGNNNNVRNNYYENKQMNSNMNLDQTTSGKTGGITFSTPSAPSTVTTNQHMIGNGSANGELGYLGIQDIVLTVERPVWWKPYDYGNLVGYPTKKVAKLSSVKGFAKISDAHIRCYATASEKEEIASLLAEGVIF